MEKAFEVAGHRFTVEMPDRYPLWDLMGQYEPFVAPAAEGTPVFSLAWAESLPAAEGCA